MGIYADRTRVYVDKGERLRVGRRDALRHGLWKDKLKEVSKGDARHEKKERSRGTWASWKGGTQS